MKFDVQVKETHYQHVEIEAESKEKAIEKVREGEGDYGSLEYHETNPPSEWIVEEKT
jgi:hypothetical protein